jgi:hypothetical protein
MLRSAPPRLTILIQASRLRQLTTAWTSTNPAMDKPMIASPAGCTLITDRQVNAKAAT